MPGIKEGYILLNEQNNSPERRWLANIWSKFI